MPVRLGILSFVLGTGLLQWQTDLPALSLAFLLLPLFVVVIFCWWSQADFLHVVSRYLLLVFLLGCGYFWAAGKAYWRLADDLPEEWQGRDVQITGFVSSLPRYDSRKAGFQFDVEHVITPNAHVPKHISLSWHNGKADHRGIRSLPAINPGERWQLTVRMKRPHGTVNPHGFDYEKWALERNIRAVGYVRESDENIRLESQTLSLFYTLQQTRQQIQQRFDQILQNRSFTGVLKTLATGDQRAISADHWQILTRTGTNHLMAISGLHITLVASLVYGLAYSLWRRSGFLLLRLPARQAGVVAGVIAALGYALLSGFAIPAQRAFIMLTVIAAAIWCNRMAAPSSVLAIALFMVVLLDPWAVLSAGFWLSFGAVTIIMLVTAGRLGILDTAGGRLAGWLRIQWAITLGLMPLLLALFQQFSLVSFFANAIAIPLVSLIVVPLTLLSALPPLDFPLMLAHGVLDFVMGFLQWLNALPQPVWQQHMPPFWAIAVAIVGVIWLLLPGSLGFGFFSGFPARWLGLLAILPLFLVFPDRPSEKALWVTVLDVGQGLAVVVQTHDHALLFDTGPAFGESDSGVRVVIPFLRGEGIRKLDKMIVSHADSDHSGGALSILEAWPVNALVSSLDQAHVIAQKAQFVTGEHIQCHAGQVWTWNDVRFEILHPPAEIYQNPQRKTNSSSCVLKITSEYGSVLIPADIEWRSEQQLLEHLPHKLPSTVLIAPHHGSLTSSSAAFVRHVNPELSIFTVGYRNRFGHPRPDVVARYQEIGATTLRSDCNGAVLIRLEQHGLSVAGWRQARPRYWHQKMQTCENGNPMVISNILTR
ncbi:MAG: DNA internalization-related competence protein ComEC/Rec2 [Burkholderiales bacterium]|nr:DNA internalization-related competence protein ComEC/Rec2 [Burkholderiales bacterium]